MAGDPASHVTVGALEAIFHPNSNNEGAYPDPVLQCVQIKPLQSGTGADRFRIVLSDIRNYVQSMLASQASHVIHEGKLKRGSFVRLKAFQTQQVKEKKILIVLGLEVLEHLGAAEKIGEPVSIENRTEPEAEGPRSTVISGSGFYGNRPAQQPAPTRQNHTQAARSSVGGGRSTSHGNIYPIEAISPYAHKWTIKARCTNKSEIKTWHNKNGEGKLFSVTLMDDSGEIRATGFNDQCDTLYDIFEEGSVYYLSSPCRVGMAKKQFSNVQNDYELTFERDTVVEKAEDQDNVPKVRYNFTPIGDLGNVEKDCTVDTIGVLKEIGDVSEIISKTTQKPYSKREIMLVDNSGYSVRLTIWGNTAKAFDVPLESVVAFKGVKVSDFGGRTLSLLSSGSMSVDPDIDEAHKLKGWYDAQGQSQIFQSHHGLTSGGMGAAAGREDNFKTLTQVKEEGLGTKETPDYFNTKATIIYIKKESISYPACAADGCNKKVVENDPGEWRCEKCDKTFPKPQYRYIMTINVSDYTGQVYLNCFDEVGRLILGMSADELMELRENDERAADEVIQAANCTSWIFKCRAKMDNFQDQTRIRYQVLAAQRIDFAAEALKLAKIIELYTI